MASERYDPEADTDPVEKVRVIFNRIKLISNFLKICVYIRLEIVSVV